MLILWSSFWDRRRRAAKQALLSSFRCKTAAQDRNGLLAPKMCLSLAAQSLIQAMIISSPKLEKRRDSNRPFTQLPWVWRSDAKIFNDRVRIYFEKIGCKVLRGDSPKSDDVWSHFLLLAYQELCPLKIPFVVQCLGSEIELGRPVDYRLR